jgi:hypothetical protein
MSQPRYPEWEESYRDAVLELLKVLKPVNAMALAK